MSNYCQIFVTSCPDLLLCKSRNFVTVCAMQNTTIAIVGSGPASLMAASQLVALGHSVEIFEAHHGPSRKLLIAGRSGLNIAHECTPTELVSHFDAPKTLLQNIFQEFSTAKWLKFVNDLGIETFVGSSHRYFVKGLKAAPLLKAWLKKLKSQGVVFHYQKQLTQFMVRGNEVTLTFNENQNLNFSAALFALGGGSWLDKKSPLSWPKLFEQKGIALTPIKAANAGFEVEWSAGFLKEAEGLPLKNILLKTTKNSYPGELMVTRYGLEGTAVYNLSKPQTVFLDLKPDLTAESLLKKMQSHKEKLAPLRLAKKLLNLCPASLALLFHHGAKSSDLKTFCTTLKHFPVTLKKQRGLEHAISSTGGVAFSEIHPSLMLKAYPGIFLAGEMLDWNAPTGGFLIQGSVSQGFFAAQGLHSLLKAKRTAAKP